MEEEVEKEDEARTVELVEAEVEAEGDEDEGSEVEFVAEMGDDGIVLESVEAVGVNVLDESD